MAKRNSHELTKLEESLGKLNQNSNKQKHVILIGDFNCPYIDWESGNVQDGALQPDVHQQLVDLAIDHNLTQIVEDATRRENTLDLCFTTNPSLIKDVKVIPGISDHDTVVVDSTIRPLYQKSVNKRMYNFAKADWPGLKTKCAELSENIISNSTDSDTIDTLWKKFKEQLDEAISTYIPTKTITKR